MTSARFLLNGANGANVSTALSPDTGSGYRFIGDGSTIKYSTAQFHEGTASVKGNGQVAFFDNGSGSTITDLDPVYVDLFCYLTTTPGADTLLLGSAYFTYAGIYVTTDKRLALKNDSGSVLTQTSANQVPTAVWFRLRAKYDATNGLVQGAMWTADLTAATPDYTLNTTSIGNVGFVCVGTDSTNVYYDDIVIQPVSDGEPTHPATGGGGIVRKGWGVVR